MVRWLMALCIALGALQAQDSGEKDQPAQKQELKRERPKPTGNEEIEAPPEEDEAMGVTEFSFNPVQSEKDVRVGNYYFKQRNYRAAAMRYRDATKWNDGNSNAWLRLGEAAEKNKDSKTAKEAYAKYLELEPEAKNVSDIKKRVSKLK